MANPEHLAILKQGKEKWNQWRKEHYEIRPDFSGATLREEILRDIDLSEADLSWTSLSHAILNGADLRQAYLRGADLTWTDLRGVNFSKANLSGVNLSGAIVWGMKLQSAIVGWVTFGDNDLSTIKGLDTIEHVGPSTIGIDTLYKSSGKIPEVFLRGCGVPEEFITYIPSLVGQALQYYSCFISYSSKDQAFAERLYADLQSKGVRCWFAPEDMKIGDRFRVRIDESIRIHEKLLLILSENSVASDWVEKEVETAMERERENRKTVLFPVRLDDSVNAIKSGWAADIRRTRHIGDFSKWENHDEYGRGFDRLLRDLKIESSAEDQS
ncbi:MAG: toll/interleukin-1 receptor domain-containing protein [Blastocatellia bacterium]